jgi:hypothetical protein
MDAHVSLMIYLLVETLIFHQIQLFYCLLLLLMVLKSISMVDLGYFGHSISDLPTNPEGLEEKPFMPFDRMNEKGLVVTMAAIPNADSPSGKEKTIDEITSNKIIIRLRCERG